MAENEKAEAPSEESAPPAKKKSPLMLIIIIVVVGLLVGGGGAVTMMLLRGGDDDNAAEQSEQAADTDGEPASPNTLGPVVPLDTFVVNLAGAGGRNYLKVDISIELSDEKLSEEITNKLPKIRDTIILVLSTKTFEEIKTSQGKVVLKDELLARLNSYLTNGTVQNLYFTSFVIQ